MPVSGHGANEHGRHRLYVGDDRAPKGAELSRMQLYMNADIPGLSDVQPDDIVITSLPLFHVVGMSSILTFACGR
jgi:acyl-CoA synthetase (AMP-forming)/AMP-acid ligase II